MYVFAVIGYCLLVVVTAIGVYNLAVSIRDWLRWRKRRKDSGSDWE